MAAQTPETSATPPAPAPAKKRNLVPILIVVGVIVIVIIGVVAYKLRGSSSSSSNKPSGPPPGAVAKGLYKAWIAGDQAAAAKDANPAAVTQMFAYQSSEGAGLTFGGCTKAASSPFPKKCVFSRPGGQLTMTVALANGTKKVTQVTLGSAATTPTSTTPTG